MAANIIAHRWSHGVPLAHYLLRVTGYTSMSLLEIYPVSVLYLVLWLAVGEGPWG